MKKNHKSKSLVFILGARSQSFKKFCNFAQIAFTHHNTY